MSVVLDASVVIAWLLGETNEAEASVRASQLEGALAPAFWPHEIANAIAVAARRKRIVSAQRPILLGLVARLEVEIETPRGVSDLTALDQLGQRYGLMAYDAAYLLLAKRREATLASLDRDLRAAAKKEGVVVAPA